MYSDKELRNNKKLYIMRKFFTKAVSMIALLGAITLQFLRCHTQM